MLGITSRVLSTGTDVLTTDNLLADAVCLWSFDDVNDIKNLQGEEWAEVNDSVQATAGVRGQAVSAHGGAGTILLSQDPDKCLTDPEANEGVSLSLWLLYESKDVRQTFLVAGQQDSFGWGLHLYQGGNNGNQERLILIIRRETESCSLKFDVPQQVWTQLLFTWTNQISTTVKVYRNGNVMSNVTKNCQSRSFPVHLIREIKIGWNHLPSASFDDIIVWKKALTELEAERLFRFYKGKLYFVSSLISILMSSVDQTALVFEISANHTRLTRMFQVAFDVMLNPV